MTSGTVSDDGAVFVSNRQNFGRKIVGCGDSFLSQLSVCFVVPQVKNNTKERAKYGIYQKARQQQLLDCSISWV